jgi:hypothetical protein
MPIVKKISQQFPLKYAKIRKIHFLKKNIVLALRVPEETAPYIKISSSYFFKQFTAKKTKI